MGKLTVCRAAAAAAAAAGFIPGNILRRAASPAHLPSHRQRPHHRPPPPPPPHFRTRRPPEGVCRLRRRRRRPPPPPPPPPLASRSTANRFAQHVYLPTVINNVLYAHLRSTAPPIDFKPHYRIVGGDGCCGGAVGAPTPRPAQAAAARVSSIME